MKNTFCVLILILLFGRLSAQVALVSPIINEYFITPTSITDAQITSVMGGEMVRVKSALVDMNSEEELLSVITTPFLLNKGVNWVRIINPSLNINFGLNESSDYVKIHHRLPDGHYRLCVEILPDIGFEIMATECQTIESEAKMILGLLYPGNKDSVETTLPMLTWTHSASGQLPSGRSFRLTLVEVEEGQNSAEALAENNPIFFISDLESRSVQYPLTATKLKEGGEYAWMVEYWDAHRMVLRSEQWSFVVKEIATPTINKYVKLQKEPTSDVYEVKDGRIYFALENSFTIEALGLVIQDELGKNYSCEKLETCLKFGNQVDLKKGSEFVLDLKEFKLPNGSYTLRISTPRNRQYELNFKKD